MLELIFLGIFVIIFLYSLFGKYTNQKIKIVNFFLIVNFVLLMIKSFLVFINGVEVYSIMGLNLFKITQLENIFILILSILGISVSVYGNFYFKHYLKHGKKLNFYFPLLILFIYSMLGVIISNEAIIFLFFWELMSISTYFLVIHEYDQPNILRKGTWYLVITHIGMFCILLSFIPFIINTGTTFFDGWHSTQLGGLINFVFFMALLGFGSKAGLFPLHVWLPRAHPIAPSNVSALMSGFMVKLPVLFMLKYLLDFFPNVNIGWGIFVLLIGGFTAFWGIFHGLIQNHIKILLAYSTIENIGIIFTGIGIMIVGLSINNSILMSIGLLAVIYHIFNHSIFKTLLFLLSGSIIDRTNNYLFSKLGGLIKKIPFIAIIFLIATIAISGLPPLNGFNSELITFYGLIYGLFNSNSYVLSITFIVVLLFLGIMSALSLVTFTKLFSITFLGNPRSEIQVDSKIDLNENISYSILISFILILSILPGFINQLIGKIGNNVINQNSYIGIIIGDINYTPLYIILGILIIFVLFYIIYMRVIKNKINMNVWNCGYPDLVAESQFKAESLVQPVRRLFRGYYSEITNKNNIAINDVNGVYKKYLIVIDYTKEYLYFVTGLYYKLVSIILKISIKLKGLQNGNIQHYIGYILITIILVLIYYINY